MHAPTTLVYLNGDDLECIGPGAGLPDRFQGQKIPLLYWGQNGKVFAFKPIEGWIPAGGKDAPGLSTATGNKAAANAARAIGHLPLSVLPNTMGLSSQEVMDYIGSGWEMIDTTFDAAFAQQAEADLATLDLNAKQHRKNYVDKPYDLNAWTRLSVNQVAWGLLRLKQGLCERRPRYVPPVKREVVPKVERSAAPAVSTAWQKALTVDQRQMLEHFCTWAKVTDTQDTYRLLQRALYEWGGDLAVKKAGKAWWKRQEDWVRQHRANEVLLAFEEGSVQFVVPGAAVNRIPFVDKQTKWTPTAQHKEVLQSVSLIDAACRIELLQCLTSLNAIAGCLHPDAIKDDAIARDPMIVFGFLAARCHDAQQAGNTCPIPEFGIYVNEKGQLNEIAETEEPTVEGQDWIPDQAFDAGLRKLDVLVTQPGNADYVQLQAVTGLTPPVPTPPEPIFYLTPLFQTNVGERIISWHISQLVDLYGCVQTEVTRLLPQLADRFPPALSLIDSRLLPPPAPLFGV